MTQGLLQLATTGTVSGLQNNQAANAALAALAGMVQGGSAPTAATTGLASTAGVWWHDTTSNLLKVRDQADANWIPYLFVDETNKVIRPIVPGALFGFTLSNDGVAPNTKINIAAGFATDDTFAGVISKPSGTLSIDCTTTGAGGLDTGTLAASKSYHAWAIGKADGTSAGFANRDDLSGLSPTLPTGYIFKRRLGSFRTDATAHILAFKQFDDAFYLSTPVLDQNGTALTANTPVNLTLASIPPGVRVRPILNVSAGLSGGAIYRVRLYSPDLPDNNSASNANIGNQSNGSTVLATWEEIASNFANTAQQIRAVSPDSGGTVSIYTMGWFDGRGKLS